MKGNLAVPGPVKHKRRISGAMMSLHTSQRGVRSSNASQIRTTIFEVTLPSSEIVRLVQYDDGMFDILRGSQPIGNEIWDDSNLEACIDYYRQVVRGIQNNENGG